MKLSFETTKYYKNNKRVSKVHGILFMILGLAVLGILIYLLAIIAPKNVRWMYEDANFGIVCSDYPNLSQSIDNEFHQFSSIQSDLSNVKQQYNDASNIDDRVNLSNQRVDYINSLTASFNNIVSLYNSNPNYFEHCYSKSDISHNIEELRFTLRSEGSSYDSDFAILRPQAEEEGYVFG